MALKPKYMVKVCTGNGWQEPVPFVRDWKLKQWQDLDIRFTLIEDTAKHLNIDINEIHCWIIRVEMVNV